MSIVLKKLSKDANNILTFMASNKLVVNPQKTGFLVHRPDNSTPSQHSIKVGDVTVQESKVQTFLGMTISAGLGWKDHINSLEQKLNARTGLQKRLT